jgi:hypothetical protein
MLNKHTERKKRKEGKKRKGRELWDTPVIPILRRPRQKDCKCKIFLSQKKKNVLLQTLNNL